MRLEIESTLATPLLTDEPSDQDVTSTEARSALNQGIKAAQAGNRAHARTLLVRATELDPRNENAWLWLASISEYPEELLGFLNNVLGINPENERALEWRAATNSLLSKTFVQRAIDAAQEGQKDFAVDCLQTALEYDDRNGLAWMWMASLSDSNVVKVGFLEKALEIDPDNSDAVHALADAKAGILKDKLAGAKTAAVSGNNAEAVKILDDLLTTNPESVDAWTLRSHLVEGFDEKIRCFESILALDPDNVAAKAGRDSLLVIFGTADAASSALSNPDPEVKAETVFDTYSHQNADSPDTSDSNTPSEVPFEIQPEAHHDNHDHEHGTEQADADETQAADVPAEAQPPELETAQPSDITFFDQTVAHFDQPTAAADAGYFDDHTGSVQEVSLTADAGHEGTDAVESQYADPHAQTVSFAYDHEIYPDGDEAVHASEGEVFPSDPEIPMPSGELPTLDAVEGTLPEEVPVHEILEASPETVDCPFCDQANDLQAFTCHACHAVLTLSDLELLLGNHNADKPVLRQAVEEMERKRSSTEFSAGQLVTLGIGHLNLRNMQLGYSCLLEASSLDPNNVVLSGQVHSLLIRLEEIKVQEAAHLRMPKGKAILVVDDSPTVRKLISGKLEKCGHDVICAGDGVEALERLDDFVPDLILLDINMPRMDGYQVCKTIRGNNATKDVPVVMISGKDGFFDKVRGRMAGTTGYITKPFGPETLMKAVEMYLSGEIPESDEE